MESDEAVIAGPQLIELSVAVAAWTIDTVSTDKLDETVDVAKVDCIVDKVPVDWLGKVGAMKIS